MRKFITGNHAVAEAVRLCRTQLVAAYPITPQTPIYEKLSDWEAAGELGGHMMRTESEHSAMAACLSASLAGIRTFTATSSQGLALMHEMLHFASGCRTAVVMCCVNRTMAAPWAFWSDQTDSLSQRDTGWIQIYCENNQEALDSVIQAFRVAEQVLLPCMVVIEANFISHFMEPVEVPSQRRVDSFLPQINIPKRFELENPGFAVPVVSQAQYQRYRKLSQEAMAYALEVIEEVDQEFGDTFGRHYGFVEEVGTEGAELVLVTTATITSTARVVIERLRQEGHKIGLVKIRVFRPFPVQTLKKTLDSAPKIAVIDRNISLGREGIFCSELKAGLINASARAHVQGYLAGIGGTNVSPSLIERIVKDALSREDIVDEPIWIAEENSC
ncbi:MAG: pyruvate ferredoxin oxidoreductase [Deltaproteobacteria bacterium]|nr:pyruvate ferredoxin oxidoreductase [Deltaproteobacteria bacterium]MBW2044152.1 pyruvate ferredoxin oxidoreductase [Deltaproteobacteria bacterium]MBW2300537.1 pyruvate ferredoxin oxidoreductase [Deltaproteobacteria bacterium]